MSHSQKELQAKRKKESYAQKEPAMKKKVLSDKAIWYKSVDPAEKEKLLSHRAEWYRSLDPKEKEKLFFQINSVVEITSFCGKTKSFI